MEVLFADDHLLVVNKPGGVPSVPDKSGDPAVATILQKENDLRGSLGMPHRLDRPVSGALVVARDVDALRAMNAAFAEGAVQKWYWAIVHGKPPLEGVWKHQLAHDGRAMKSRVGTADGAWATTRFTTLVQGERYTLLELEPEEGRFHQLRAQCAAAGHPIKGDVKYGARRGDPDRTIALHARSLRFAHPLTGKSVGVEAPVPGKSLWAAFVAQLRV